MRAPQGCVPRAGSVLLAMALVTAWCGAARAHSRRVDLALWGSFAPDTARCQRAISHAAAVCVQHVLNVRNTCMGQQLAGTTCDSVAVNASVQAARSQAVSRVQQVCTQTELSNLSFVDLSDATADVINICRQLDTAAVSAAFGPAMVAGSLSEVDGPTQTCLDAAAQGVSRLMEFAIRVRQRALDRIAATNLQPSQKLALVAGTTHQITRVGALVKRRIGTVCSDAQFSSLYGRSMDQFLGTVAQRADCLADGVYVQNAVTCPAAVCGNGMQEPGEECDDGNSFEGDGCKSDCTKVSCEVFPTTYDLIQRAVFENHGCTADACHGSARSGGLDLRADVSYDNLVDVPAQTVPGMKRVDPGSKANSLLWLNLAAATLPDQYKAPLRAMPLGGNPLSGDELEAMRIWIETGGASRTAAVNGTAGLLSACLPEPKPVQIAPLEPPAPGEGVQLHMPAWTLPPNSESEVCFSSYYDVSAQVPPELLSADGLRFRYKQVDIRQDPLSHHLIVDLYHGTEAANDPVWGPYSCRGGQNDGQTCDPLALGACGTGSECATAPDPTAIACIGFGPQTGLTTLTRGGFAFSQSTAAQFKFPAGVYDEVPVKGVVLWNSHAFNLTRQAGKMEAWVNIYFPKADEQVHRQEQIFNTTKIFWNADFPPFPLPELAAFQDMEVCQIHLFGRQAEPYANSLVPANQTVHLFELSGHMHEHGKRFRIFRGAFSCKGGAKQGTPCSPLNPEMCPDGTCTDAGGREPQASLLYTNYIYNDPNVVRFDPPILISGSAAPADRSLTYCAHYSNGAPPDIQDVKRRSTSPPAGTIFGIPIGGPCAASRTSCIGGPQQGQSCNGNNAACDSTSGAGDGVCDACPLTGGFRTTDEMFILFGNFWLE